MVEAAGIEPASQNRNRPGLYARIRPMSFVPKSPTGGVLPGLVRFSYLGGLPPDRGSSVRARIWSPHGALRARPCGTRRLIRQRLPTVCRQLLLCQVFYEAS